MEYGDFLQCVQEYAKKETGRGGVIIRADRHG